MKIRSLILGAAMLAGFAGAASAAQFLDDSLIISGGWYSGGSAIASPPSCRMFSTGGAPAQVAADGADSTPVATTVYISEMRVDYNCVATGLANFNGSVASGNLKVGLADSTGGIIATSASTAMSGTDSYQLVPFVTPVTLIAGRRYYALLFIDNTTARYNAYSVGAFGSATQTGQVYATGFTTITPPTTFGSTQAPIMSAY